MTWTKLMEYIQQLESENADLQRQLAEATDYIEHFEDQRR